MLNGCNLWLLKPHELNRGRGISLFNKLSAFKTLINANPTPPPVFDPTQKVKTEPSTPDRPSTTISATTRPANLRSNKYVIQKYLERPFLIHGRKFDMRIFALVDHEMNLYFYKEWYIRLSCEQFTLKEGGITN